MSQEFFTLLSEIQTYGCALPPSMSRPKPVVKPMPVHKPAEPMHVEVEAPAQLQAALEAPMQLRPGMTVGEHLAEFDDWTDSNGNSFDRLIHMGLTYAHEDKGWSPPSKDWNSKLPWNEPEKAYTVGKVEPKRNGSNNMVLDRILSGSEDGTPKSKKRAREADDDLPAKVSKLKVEPSDGDVLQHAKEEVTSSQLKKPSRGSAPTKGRKTKSSPKATLSSGISSPSGSPLKQELAHSDSETEHLAIAIRKTAKATTAKKAAAAKKAPAPKKSAPNKKFAKTMGVKLTRAGRVKAKNDDDDDDLPAVAKLSPEQIAARKANKKS